MNRLLTPLFELFGIENTWRPEEIIETVWGSSFDWAGWVILLYTASGTAFSPETILLQWTTFPSTILCGSQDSITIQKIRFEMLWWIGELLMRVR